jgi:cyclophilin family peptidyl-prolyl cis-trans isomerase
MKRLWWIAAAAVLVAACGKDDTMTLRDVPPGPVPDTFRVVFETTKGRFVVEAYKPWAPVGVQRFYELASMGAFDENAFYRVVPNFVAQFGTPGDPKVTAKLDSVTLPDEKRVARNERGTVAFAQEGKNSRSHTIFINRRDNEYLDSQGFVPIGRVVEGMAVVDSLQWPYIDKPDHHMLATIGNRYMRRNYPKTDYVKSAAVVPDRPQ